MVEQVDNLPMFPAGSTDSKAVINKKRRNLPGMPDPDAEVIGLTPKELLATNRFVCEICNKGFQRDQNLQLHRRGHNLPWKLRQRTSKEVRKRVYICPEPTCAHHDPTRALGDLTGIKKHFCRKHGEKKYKCDRCLKKYAVLSDLKAHVKTCGTREYRRDCGTLFSRRDSFITHRAFCDALAQETARTQPASLAGDMGPNPSSTASDSPPQPEILSPVLSVQSSAVAELPENNNGNLQSPGNLIVSPAGAATVSTSSSTTSGGMISDHGGSFCIFTSSASELTRSSQSHQPPLWQPSFQSLLRPIAGAALRSTSNPISLTLSPSLYGSRPSFTSVEQNPQPHYFPTPSSPAILSATALLQKASQMGATSSSNSSFLHGLQLPQSPISAPSAAAPWGTTSADNSELPASCLNRSMYRQSGIFRNKQDGGGTWAQDFLRLGTGGAFSGMCSELGALEDSSEPKSSIL